MAPWIFGHGKRLHTLETAVTQIDENVRKGFQQISSKLDEMEGDFVPEEATPSTTHPNIPEEGTPEEKALTNPLAAIEEQLSKTTDPRKIADLLEARTMIKRRFAGERGQRSRYLRERFSRRPREPDEIIQSEEELGESHYDVDRIAQEVGVGKNGSLDPQKLYSGLQGIMKNPAMKTMAQAWAKKLGIEDLDGAMGMLGQVVADPKKTQELATVVGTGLSGLIKDKINPFIQPRGSMIGQPITPMQAGQVGTRPTAPDGFPLYNVRGQWIDPRQPYPVAGT